MSLRLIKNAITAAVEQVKESLPDEEIFDWRKHLLPKVFPFLEWKDELRNKSVLTADLQAGLLGAIMVLPQGVAFAMIAGLPPIYGLYTAMITPIVAALMGSSRHLVSGPTTAISLVVASTVGRFAESGSDQYIEMTLVLTFLTGAIQLGMGIGRLGRYIGFVSHTVVVGFTAGAAMLIMTSQIKNMLGVDIPGHASFFGTWKDIFQHFWRLDPEVSAVAGATLLAAVVTRRVSKRIPYLLVALAVGTAAAFALGGEAAGIRFVGQMPPQLPPFSLPALSAENIHLLLPNAFALALLGLVEAVAISRSVALKSGQTIEGNQEFIGQGASNIVGSFFSCYAGSGSFSRTGLNFESGAKTPASAIFAAVFLMLTVLFIAPYAAYLPMPAMAGLIVLVGWNLLDLNQMEEIQLASREDNIILGVTFFTAILAELEFAIYLGVLLSLYFYLKRTATPNIAVMATDPTHPRHPFINTMRKEVPLCPQTKIIRIDGNLYFGAIQHVSATLREHRRGTEKWLMLLASGINHVDLDGAEWLVNEAKYWREKKGGGMLIVRLKLVAQEVLSDGGYLDEIGQENLFTSKTDAVAALYAKLDRNVCRACPNRVFIECETDAGLPPVLKTK
jgi:sulfate permease, SulP family